MILLKIELIRVIENECEESALSRINTVNTMHMVLDFDKYATKGNEFIRLVSMELEVPRDMAGRITRAVLHALRNRFSHQESFQLMAQLPMAIKAVYVDGWRFSKGQTRLRHITDLLDEVRLEDGKLSGYDFGNNSNALRAVKAVFTSISSFVSAGQMTDLMLSLPLEVRTFLEDATLHQEQPVKK
ncbi:MAG: DUF2267 domain-containing protein [Chitinophagaceae bacterium]|nr:DUF2267 domain-containing protein [Chitinophagaceae bacterium]NCW88275.1 DUF2267 domain-containing protein [Chitinophagia bacterium]